MWGSKVTKGGHKTSKNLHAEEQKWEQKGGQKTGKNMFGAKTFLICLFITFLSPRWGAPKRPPQDLADFGATFGRPQDLADFGTRFCRPWAPWPIRGPSLAPWPSLSAGAVAVAIARQGACMLCVSKPPQSEKQ